MLGLTPELLHVRLDSCDPQFVLHVFDSEAVVIPLRPMANRFGGCFCLGSGPVFCVFCFVFLLLLRFFRWRNASLAGGFAGRLFCFRGLWFCCFYRFANSKDPVSLYSVYFQLTLM